MSSDSPIDHQQWPDTGLQDTSKSYALSGRIMLASIVVLFIVVVSLVLLHLYARWYLLRVHLSRRNRHNRRIRSTRIVFYVDNNRAPTSPTGGLAASVIKSLPVFVFSSKTDENTPECAVCLSEFEEGETGRLLPKCKHNFHTECIDMWFHSNSTCPLCRSPVEAVETTSFQTEPVGNDIVVSVNSPVQPIGLEPGIATTSYADKTKRVDVRIDVPNRNELAAESEFASPSQGFRSPGSRLLSRIINMSRKSPAVSPSSGAGTSCVLPVAAAELDLESASQESSRLESHR